MESISRYLYRKTNNTWLFLALSLSITFLVWLRANPNLFIFGESYLINWVYTHYLFNYESGFVKRGLIGELLSILSIHASYPIINVIAYSSAFTLAFLMFFILIKLWSTNRESYGFFLFMLLIITSPVTLQHFFRDVGRFDIYIYTGVIALLYVLGSRTSITNFILINCFLSVFILIHEAAFFMVVPMTLMYWHYIDSTKNSTILQVISFCFILFLTYLISTNGDYTSLSLKDHTKELVSIYGNKVIESSVAVIHKSDLEYNIYMTFEKGLTLERLLHHVYFLLFMLPLIYFSRGLYQQVKEQLTLKSRILLLSGLSPLALYPLGHDHFRWWSLAITNIMLIIIFLCFNDKKLSEIAFRYFESQEKLIVFMIVLGFILGPLGYIKSFGVAENLNQTIEFMVSHFLI